MKIINKFIISFMVAMLLLSVSVLAKEAKRDWIDKSYDFAKIRTVLIMPTDVKNNEDDKMLPIVLNGMITDKFNNNNAKNNIRFINLDDAYLRLRAITGEDFNVLAKSDVNKYFSLWNSNISKVCDVILTSAVISMSTETFTYTKTVNEVLTVDEEQTNSNNNNKTKNTTVTIPIQKTVTAERVSAGMEFTLLNASTQKPVWYVMDSRERVNDYIGSTSPEDMFKRITERTFGIFQKLF